MIAEKVKFSQSDLEDQVANLSKAVNGQITEIYRTHLWKNKLVGPAEKYKSLMDYATAKIPELNDKSKKAGEDAVQGLFLIK